MGSQKVFLLLILVLFYVVSLVSCTEFEAGGENGWIIPQSSNQSDMFNQWASKNRFKVGDTIRFKYKKDSVLVVSEDEYKKCQTTKPELYSNHDDTVFKLDRPGLFYFISGVAGHCEKGQKMIIKVMEVEPTPQSPPPSSSLHSSTHKSNHAVRKTSWFIGVGLVTISILVLTSLSLV
ncbi:PREDICTED: early nodulin-like protein 1 [Camelina sativa]|uniref:Early nodulin-like protein 1 n=1 Tax=Camelina sativa TaxID=90675 RepID=A0ABM0X1R1_CAMSA|nr:PREDICTED: early nodulin-like protein 1 [Camelina sativa]